MRHEVLQGVISLVLIIPLIIATVYLLKRFGKFPSRSTARLKLIDQLTLAPKHQLLIVEVDGQPILLGLSPNQINHIEQVSLRNKNGQTHV